MSLLLISSRDRFQSNIQSLVIAVYPQIATYIYCQHLTVFFFGVWSLISSVIFIIQQTHLIGINAFLNKLIDFERLFSMFPQVVTKARLGLFS